MTRVWDPTLVAVGNLSCFALFCVPDISIQIRRTRKQARRQAGTQTKIIAESVQNKGRSLVVLLLLNQHIIASPYRQRDELRVMG